MTYTEILQNQKTFFLSQKTKNIQFRKTQLKKLRKVVTDNEVLLNEAIYEDFGKSAYENYMTEISIVLGEIDFFLKNLNTLSKPKKVRTNLVNQIGKSRII